MDPRFLCQEVGSEPPPDLSPAERTASTVRGELSELHSALEEAKADIVGLWALHYMLDRGLIDSALERSMYVTYLVGSVRTMRFGLKEAHGKGHTPSPDE